MSAQTDIDPPGPMYLEAADHPLASALERHCAEIRAEMLALPRDRYEPVADDLVVAGRWAALGLIDRLDPDRARRWQRNAQACPHTSRVLGRIQGLHVGGFLLMTPGTRLRPHADLQDPRFVNFMLALEGGAASWMRVGTELRPHADGRCVVFDPRLEHEAGNDGDRERVTMYAAVSMAAARLPILAPAGAT